MKNSIIAAALILVLIFITGCAGVSTSLAVGVRISPEERQVSTSEIGPFENNSTVRLDAGRYRGDLSIEANKVRLEGAGSRSTSINGDVYINGNTCKIRALTVTGDVYLNGNNNSLRSVKVNGEVISSGNNNSW